MTTLKEIEKAVEGLPPHDLQQFRDWFADFEADKWDRQIEGDVGAGRLDFLVAEAKVRAFCGGSFL